MRRLRAVCGALLFVLGVLGFGTLAQAQTQEFCSYKSSATPQAVCIRIAATTFEISQSIGFQAWIEDRQSNGTFAVAPGNITIREGSRVVDSGSSVWNSSLDYYDLLTVGTHNVNLRGSNSSLDISLIVQRHTPYLAVNVDPLVSRVGQTVNVLTSANLFHPTAALRLNVILPGNSEVEIWRRNFVPPDSGSHIIVNVPASFSFVGPYAVPGNYRFYAAYTGDVFNNALNIGGVVIPVGPFGTTTALSQSSIGTKQGIPFTLSATVNSTQAGNPAPTGSVEFYDGTTLLGSATLNAQRTATFTGRLGKVGAHSLTARYLGDTNNQASTSAPASHEITFNPALMVPIFELLLN